MSSDDQIDLARGVPAVATPESAHVEAIKAIESGQREYTASQGILELRQAVTDDMRRYNGLDFDPSQIVVGGGAKQVLFSILLANLKTGDEVVTGAPFYPAFRNLTQMLGGTSVLVPGDPENQYKMTPQGLRAAITPRTRILFLNSPANPTGAVYTRAELAALAEVFLTVENGIIVADELYEGLTVGAPHTSIASLSPEIAARTLTVQGVSKIYAMTGWRVGYAAGPQSLIDGVTRMISATVNCASSISQWAAYGALSESGAVRIANQDLVRAARDATVAELSGSPLSFEVPDGGIYVFARYPGAIDDVELTRRLTEDYGVRIHPGSNFGEPGAVRITFAGVHDTLVEGLRRFRAGIEELAQ